MPLHIAILCFPGVQPLDLIGPYEVFAAAKGVKIHLVWKTLDTVTASTGLALKPDTTFADLTECDVLCIPGGTGVDVLLTDEETLSFVRDIASRARYVTSVCTGALVLGRAGLLTGRRATTHWNAHDLLASFGAIPVKERVVRDGPLITAGGVTSGIDFGLVVVAELLGREEAETVQLLLEYAPAPPFGPGEPERSTPAALVEAQDRLAPSKAKREAVLR